MLCLYHDDLFFFHITSLVVVFSCQNIVIILCCHHIMTSCASFICCWVTMLYWMFGTDLTFGTSFRLKPFRYSVTPVFCSFDSSPVTLQPKELTDLVKKYNSSDLLDCKIGVQVQEGRGKGYLPETCTCTETECATSNNLIILGKRGSRLSFYH